MARKRTRKNLQNLLGEDSQAAGFFEPEQAPARQRSARVVSIPLSQCLPDRFQARIILPLDIKGRFFAGQIDCYQAAGAMLEAAAYDSGLQAQVEKLLQLGENISAHGQIEPATGSWVSAGQGPPVFALEVGERRFWSLALTAVAQGLESEPLLRVVEENAFSRARQISENVHREGSTAVDRARAIAGLILLQLDMQPDPAIDDDLDYFRQIFEIKRLPNGTWAPVEKTMQLSRQALERHLNILKLPSELVYLAKLYELPEARLREIVASPPDLQRELLQLAIKENATAQDLRRTAQAPRSARKRSRPPAASPHKKAASRLKSLLKLARQPDFKKNYEEVATEFSAGTQNAEDLLEAAGLLEEQARWLRALYQRRQ